jgi:hypothetical protein
MKWQFIEKKYNPNRDRIQEYTIEIDTKQKANTLEVNVSVSRCPRRQKPMSWGARDVKKWLNEKGISVKKSLKVSVLTDIGDCKAHYIFETDAANKTRNSKKTSKKKATSTTATTRIINTPTRKQNNTNTPVQTEED